jgi:hypothetical protein
MIAPDWTTTPSPLGKAPPTETVGVGLPVAANGSDTSWPMVTLALVGPESDGGIPAKKVSVRSDSLRAVVL